MSAPTERLSVLAVATQIVLMQADRQLPEPLTLDITSSNTFINIRLTSRADVDAWITALGGKAAAGDSQILDKPGDDGRPLTLHTNSTRNWGGWYVYLTATVAEPSSAVDADALAQLRALAGAR